MLRDKYRVYSASRVRESSINHIMFLYDELIKLLTQSMNTSGPKRQAILEKAIFILEGLISSIVGSANSELAKKTRRFYLHLLKNTTSIIYNADESLCIELIKKIDALRNATRG